MDESRVTQLTCAGARHALLARTVEPACRIDEVAVQRHLAGCPACRERQRLFRAFAGALDVRQATEILPALRIHRSLRQRVAQRAWASPLRQRPGVQRRSRARAWRGTLAASAAALAVVLGATRLDPARTTDLAALTHSQPMHATVADSYAVRLPSRLPEGRVTLPMHRGDTLLSRTWSPCTQPADSI
ncbi:MAG: hypothetical protein AB1505_35730 [Candidatus Latescibacterota bacterium]